MNGTAARRASSTQKVMDAPPQELFTEGLLQAQVFTKVRGNGRSLVHGLPVQIAYATIDATLVCLIGVFVVWCRFGVGVPLAPRCLRVDQGTAYAYASFFTLYALLVILGCASQNLYRTPRDRSVLDENMMVAKAVGIASALLVLFIFTSGDKSISRLVIASAGVALNVVVLSGWRYFRRRLVLRRALEGIGVSRVLIVGIGLMGRRSGEVARRDPHLGYVVCGFLDSKPSS